MPPRRHPCCQAISAANAPADFRCRAVRRGRGLRARTQMQMGDGKPCPHLRGELACVGLAESHPADASSDGELIEAVKELSHRGANGGIEAERAHQHFGQTR